MLVVVKFLRFLVVSTQFYWKRSGWIVIIIVLLIVIARIDPAGLSSFVWARFATHWRGFAGLIFIFRLIAAIQVMLCAISIKRKLDKKEAVGTFNPLSWVIEMSIAVLAFVLCLILLPVAFGDPVTAALIELVILVFLGIVLSNI